LCDETSHGRPEHNPRPFRIAVEDARPRLAGARLQIDSLTATYRERLADLRLDTTIAIVAL
jgi:hypothetical protein